MSGTADESSSSSSLCNYFAIGSMMHPESMKQRKIAPIRSQPAELLDQRIHFFGAAGFAEAVPEEGASFHGVVHQITHETMDELDKVELTYKRKQATAKLYDGTLITVTVYYRDEEELKRCADQVDNPPTDRYLAILTDGARHFQLKQEYIEFLEQHERQPRPDPKDFLSLQIPAGIDRVFAFEEVEAGDGEDGRPLLVSIRGKVIEYVGSNTFVKTTILVLRREHGPSLEMCMSRAQYDPKYGLPGKLEDFTREHAAVMEHEFCVSLQGLDVFESFKVIGVFEQRYKD